MEKQKIQDNSNFGLLKKMEKENLTKFFISNKSKMIEDIETKINNFIINYDFNELTTKIIKYENENYIYSQKIKKELEKIENDVKEFEIKYLNIIVIGRCGVGKTSLINSILPIENQQSFSINDYLELYISETNPFLRFVKTKGIDLTKNIELENIIQYIEKYIKNNLKSRDPDNFVQCIWFCIRGPRIEKIEIKILKNFYNNYNIPIIIVYTDAIDKHICNEMKNHLLYHYFVNASFVPVLTRRTLILISDIYLGKSGLDTLIDETLDKSQKYLSNKMRTVVTNNISSNIVNKLIKENNYITKYIYETIILFFTTNYLKVLNDNNFIKFIINIFVINIENFFMKNKTDKFFNYFKDNEIIIKHTYNYIKYYKNYTNSLIKSWIDSTNKEKLSKSKELIEASSNYLIDNFYYVSQVYYIYYIIKTWCNPLTKSFEINLNTMINDLISSKDMKKLINECFDKKFNEFRNKVKDYFDKEL